MLGTQDVSHSKTFIIACGGSGGHIYPALAIAKTIEENYPASRIIFVGCKTKMEMVIVPKYGYEIIGLGIMSLKRNSIIANLFLPLNIIKNLFLSFKIIKSKQPVIVLGMGGYVSFPTVIAASFLGVSTIIHESNAIAGLANKILSIFVSKICISYESVKKFFPLKKTVLTGTPVRQSLLLIDRNKAFDFFDLDKEKSCLLIFGGSLGALNINNTILNSLSILVENNIQLIWIVGNNNYSKFNDFIPDNYAKLIKIYPFLNEIELAYAAADIIVSRAGALSVAEICVIKKPAIFIPSPNVTNNHQHYNIERLVKDRGAIKVEERDLDQLIKKILWLITNKEEQKIMVDNMGSCLNKDAIKNILEVMNQSMKKNSRKEA